MTTATKEAVLEEAITAVASRMLTLEQIKAATDRETTEFEVPAWGGSVRYRGLSFDEMAIAREKSWDPKKKETSEDLLNAWVIALGLVEPKIDYLVAKDWIIERSFGAVNSLLTEILTASGLGPRAQEAAKSAPEG